MKNIGTIANQENPAGKGKVQAKQSLPNMGDRTHGTLRGQKMIKKALNMREAELPMQQGEPEK